MAIKAMSKCFNVNRTSPVSEVKSLSYPDGSVSSGSGSDSIRYYLKSMSTPYLLRHHKSLGHLKKIQLLDEAQKNIVIYH